MAITSFWIKELDEYHWFKDLNIFFLSMYLLDVVLKIVMFGIQDYFSDAWNKFDFFLALF